MNYYRPLSYITNPILCEPIDFDLFNGPRYRRNKTRNIKI